MTEQSVHFVVLAFDDEFKADESRIALKRAAGDGLIQLAETAVAVRDKTGKAHLTQDVDLQNQRKMQGHWVGIAAAVVTGVQPLILAGTAVGAIVGRLTDSGIKTGQLKDVEKALAPGTSALFILAHETRHRQAVIDRLRPFGGQLIESDLPSDVATELDELMTTA